MILWYLMYSEIKNRLVILIIDAKVGLTRNDADMLKTLYEHHINHIIVANKVDNLQMSQKEKQLLKIKQECKNSEVIPYSSRQKYQRDELTRRISSYIN